MDCFFLYLSRCELQVSQSSGHTCGPRPPHLSVHSPAPAGRPHCHDTCLYFLLPLCSSSSGDFATWITGLWDFGCTHLTYCNFKTVVTTKVVILLYVANLMVRWLWRRGLDPDNYSIPYLTALGDLLGTGFLALSFRLILMVSSTWTGVWHKLLWMFGFLHVTWKRHTVRLLARVLFLNFCFVFFFKLIYRHWASEHSNVFPPQYYVN